MKKWKAGEEPQMNSDGGSRARRGCSLFLVLRSLLGEPGFARRYESEKVGKWESGKV